MAYEIELKLRYDPSRHKQLVQLLNARAENRGSARLKNRYFDTTDGQLVRSGSALRIRQSGDTWEQTLKSRGQSEAGLFRRHEWNWPINTQELNVPLLQTPDVLSQCGAGSPLADTAVLAQLGCLFETNFERQSWHWRVGDTLVELVLDQGQVQLPAPSDSSLQEGEGGSGPSLPLCELELELIEGEVRMLWWMAESLCSLVPLWISEVSKAERGYRLAGLSRPPSLEVSPQPLSRMAIESVPAPAVVSHYLGQFKRALETCLWEEPSNGAMLAAENWLAVLALTQHHSAMAVGQPRQHLIGPLSELAALEALVQAPEADSIESEESLNTRSMLSIRAKHMSQLALAAQQWRSQPSLAQQCLMFAKWSWQQLADQERDSANHGENSGVADDSAKTMMDWLERATSVDTLDAWKSNPVSLVSLLLTDHKAATQTTVRALLHSLWRRDGLQHHGGQSELLLALDQQQAQIQRLQSELVQRLVAGSKTPD